MTDRPSGPTILYKWDQRGMDKEMYLRTSTLL